MAFVQLSNSEIDARVGNRHAATGIEYPANGLQPYYHWLVRTLHDLAESSNAALRVGRDDASVTSVRIAPGSALLDTTVMDYAGEAIDLAAWNNSTVLLWLANESGPVVKVGLQSAGWPTVAHVRLATVTLATGQVTQVLDNRGQTQYHAAQTPARPDADALTATQTADASYDATEQAMLNALKADVTHLRSVLNDLLAKLRAAGVLSN